MNAFALAFAGGTDLQDEMQRIYYQILNLENDGE